MKKNIYSIQEGIKALDIKEEFKSLIYNLIEAEILNIQRLYFPIITISKHQKEGDDRVFVELQLELESPNDEFGISLFQCRPFIDKGCIMISSESKITLRKAYFIYNEPQPSGK